MNFNNKNIYSTESELLSEERRCLYKNWCCLYSSLILIILVSLSIIIYNIENKTPLIAHTIKIDNPQKGCNNTCYTVTIDYTYTYNEIKHNKTEIEEFSTIKRAQQFINDSKDTITVYRSNNNDTTIDPTSEDDGLFTVIFLCLMILIIVVCIGCVIVWCDYKTLPIDTTPHIPIVV